MKSGNWVPISKAGVHFLPHDRPYTELEAMFCLQCDADDPGKTVTVSGYADMWRWSRKKVSNFLKRSGVEIFYPEKKKRNQRGYIKSNIRDIKGTNKEHIFSFKSKDLGDCENIKGTNEEHKRDIKGSTTINNNNNNKNKNMSPPQSAEPDFLAEIESLLSGYNGNRAFIESALDAIAATRKSGKMADSVRLAILKKFAQYDSGKVLSGIQIYIDRGYHLEGKNENYLFGIIRNNKPAPYGGSSGGNGKKSDTKPGHGQSFLNAWMAMSERDRRDGSPEERGLSDWSGHSDFGGGMERGHVRSQDDVVEAEIVEIPDERC